MIVVEKNDITTAYYESLSRLVDKWNPYPVLIQIEKPIIDAEIIVDPELNLKGLNIEKKMHDKFKEFEFEDGKKGKFWIKDRIKVLINDEGEYRRRLNKK